jgi:hypothetical protein
MAGASGCRRACRAAPSSASPCRRRRQVKSAPSGPIRVCAGSRHRPMPLPCDHRVRNGTARSHSRYIANWSADPWTARREASRRTIGRKVRAGRSADASKRSSDSSQQDLLSTSSPCMPPRQHLVPNAAPLRAKVMQQWHAATRAA